ncbi:hypothetical protein [Streptomyces sp. TLI_171]|uniref:hypothetical protein n=1 Tax=Streptomyces sp. TLI_171 TaxID=1938859 RepID=UPI000C4D0D19|nr:hypothetical protein [Streptomyces sp. TLI_171]RKE20275.1 hypothetical protein BX266_3628 [Streptomyces sp. TLI_171]
MRTRTVVLVLTGGLLLGAAGVVGVELEREHGRREAARSADASAARDFTALVAEADARHPVTPAELRQLSDRVRAEHGGAAQVGVFSLWRHDAERMVLFQAVAGYQEWPDTIGTAEETRCYRLALRPAQPAPAVELQDCAPPPGWTREQ